MVISKKEYDAYAKVIMTEYYGEDRVRYESFEGVPLPVAIITKLFFGTDICGEGDIDGIEIKYCRGCFTITINEWCTLSADEIEKIIFTQKLKEVCENYAYDIYLEKHDEEMEKALHEMFERHEVDSEMVDVYMNLPDMWDDTESTGKVYETLKRLSEDFKDTEEK